MSRIDTRKSLLRERGQCAAELAAALLSGNDDIATARLKSRLEMINSAIAVFPSTRSTDFWRAAIVGLVTALAVTVLLVKEAHFVPAIIDVRSRTLGVDLESSGSLSSIDFDGSVHVRGSEWLVTPPAIDSDSAAPGDVTVLADWLRLESLDYPANATLEFRRGPRSLSLFVTGAPATAQLQANGNADVEIGAAPANLAVTQKFDSPETFRFGIDEADDSRKSDRMLEIIGDYDAEDSTATALVPSNVRFLERAAGVPGGVQRDQSSIISGTVSFKGVKRTFNLSDGDVLAVEGLSDARGHVTIASDIHLNVLGTARVVAISNEGTRRSLAPSLLEYFAENHAIALAWGALVFVAGLLWSASKFLFR